MGLFPKTSYNPPPDFNRFLAFKGRITFDKGGLSIGRGARWGGEGGGGGGSVSGRPPYEKTPPLGQFCDNATHV